MNKLLTLTSAFIKEHPKAAASFLSIMIVKVVLSIFTPLSEDFLNSAMFIGPTPLLTILRNDGPYLLWMLLAKGIHTVWQMLPLQHPHIETVVGFWYFIPSPSLQVLVFMLKLPLLVFDALCALLIHKIAFSYTASNRSSLTASTLWLLNPYVTMTSEMLGNFDVIVAFFILMSILNFTRGRYVRSAATLMISTFLKPYPLLLLPIFIILLLKLKDYKGTAKFLLTIVLPSGAVLIPLLAITSTLKNLTGLLDYYFEKGSTFLTGFVLESYASKTSFVQVRIGLTIVFAVLYIFIMVEFWKGTRRSLLDAILGFTLVIFAFSFWHPQLLLWVLPIIALDYAINRTPKFYPIIFTLTAFIFELIYFSFYFTSYGNSFFFIPNYNPQLLTLSQSIQDFYKTPLWIGPIAIIARSIFLSVCSLYVIRILLRNTHIITTYSQDHKLN